MESIAPIRIGSRLIGEGHEPYIIAEMSGNHNQSLARALELVEAAAAAGAHAVKLQTYTADTMTLNQKSEGFIIDNPDSLWAGASLYELYDEAHTPWEWHEPIMKRASELGLECFSSPFDHTAVDFLESLDVPAYKIASFESLDLPLIRRVAQTGKPIIISTGMATAAELDLSVREAREAGCKDLILLKCTSNYPAAPESTNVRTIPHMRSLFRAQIGLSDHTMGHGVACASVAMGATVVEKHFTLRRADGGVDSQFSLEPEELQALVVETRRAWQSLGRVSYGPTPSEEASLQFRRRLYVVSDMRAGDRITETIVRPISPGYGLPPGHLDTVLGMKVTKDAPRGTPLTWELFK